MKHIVSEPHRTIRDGIHIAWDVSTRVTSDVLTYIARIEVTNWRETTLTLHILDFGRFEPKCEPGCVVEGATDQTQRPRLKGIMDRVGMSRGLGGGSFNPSRMEVGVHSGWDYMGARAACLGQLAGIIPSMKGDYGVLKSRLVEKGGVRCGAIPTLR
jgi:hypothetical protein